MIQFESNRQTEGRNEGEKAERQPRLLGNIREALAVEQLGRQSSKVGLLRENKRLGASNVKSQGKSLEVS